jgi:uncharacterized protein (TIGR02271 family)
VRLDGGLRLSLPAGELVRRRDGALLFRGSFEELASAARARDWKEGGGRVRTGAEVVPVVEEELRVGKRVVETGRVRVTKSVSEREELVDEPLLREEYEVERVPVNVYVDEPVGPRHEGETLVVPVLEEVLVVEKRLLVREELRITRRRTEGRDRRSVTLLSEEVSVERTGPREGRGEADGTDGGRPA